MNNNYRTLNKDIGLVQRTNNGWDLWFEDGDTVKATEFHSLQVGIIIACLTSWNYLNRYGNPTYEIFGNRAYELLKTNKSSMTAYKIQQYFIECLKRMRRVYEIVYLEVKETPNEPYTYFVEFQVLSITNELVSGSFPINEDKTKSTSFITYNTLMPYASVENPLTIDLWLKNEYGGGLNGEILYIYLKKDTDEDYRFIGVTDMTDENGYVRVTYTPNEETDPSGDYILYFQYKGNTTYNPSNSQRTSFEIDYVEQNISIINYPVTTSVKENNITVSLTETHSTGEITPLVQTLVLLKGSDGSVYEKTTNYQGEAVFRVIIDETDTTTLSTETTYTAYYNNKTDECTITIIPKQLVLEVMSDKQTIDPLENMTIEVSLKDSSNRIVKNYPVKILENDEVLLESKTDELGKATFTKYFTTVGEHTLTVLCDSSTYYIEDNEEISVTVNKYTCDAMIYLKGWDNQNNQYVPIVSYDPKLLLNQSLIVDAQLKNSIPQNMGLINFTIDGELFDTVEITDERTYSSKKYDFSTIGEYVVGVRVVPNADNVGNLSPSELHEKTIEVLEHNYAIEVTDIKDDGVYVTDGWIKLTDNGKPLGLKQIHIYSEDTGYDEYIGMPDVYRGFHLSIDMMNPLPVNGLYVFEFEDARTEVEIYTSIIIDDSDLTDYLLDIENYDYLVGDSSKMIIQNDILYAQSPVSCVHQEEFTDKTNWELSFEWCIARGIDGGFLIGDSNDYYEFIIEHHEFIQEYSYFRIYHCYDNGRRRIINIRGNYNISDFVPVKITRNNDEYIVDINEGQIVETWNDNNIKNGFGLVSNIYTGLNYSDVKNLMVNTKQIEN